MTQPSTLSSSFDTSLIDVQQSFSSTETNTSSSSTKEDVKPPDKPHDVSPYKTIPTDQLYEQWASTYDTDGNVLQAVDGIQMKKLLPKFVRLTRNDRDASTEEAAPLRILDLGCGTGRNTLKLLQANWDAGVHIYGWDISQAMLDIAKKKCNELPHSSKLELTFQEIDLKTSDSVPETYNQYFDGLISTLVLEHIPAETFFNTLAKVLKSGSYALVTNMHHDMGAVSRAGFKTASGERFKGMSYIHTPESTVAAAIAAGLELVGDVDEAGVEADLIDGRVVEKGLVADRAKKWVGIKVWFGMILRKR